MDQTRHSWNSWEPLLLSSALLVIFCPQRAGKSSAGNTILRTNLFDFKGSSRRTTHCEISHSMVENRRLTVVDSPGWFYMHTLQETNEMDKLELENSMYLCPSGPHAVLLVIHLTTAIQPVYLRAVQEHMSLFTEEIWKHTIALVTRGDWLGLKTVDERIESEEGMQWIVNKCGNRYHVLNNMDHSDKAQVKDLLENIEEIWAENEKSYYEVNLSRTTEIETKKRGWIQDGQKDKADNEGTVKSTERAEYHLNNSVILKNGPLVYLFLSMVFLCFLFYHCSHK
uniref:AIG1-type G domain-containing protein n=1 Tax=Kryptolebias marmoratus TaxID=37003 RepID=A0A3Q3FNP3_KRYMA